MNIHMRVFVFILSITLFFTACEKYSDDNGTTVDIPRIPGNPDTNFDQQILEGYFVIAIDFDSQGNAWIGTFDQGLIKYNSNETILYNSSNSVLPDGLVIWDVAVDGQDRVWIGSNDYGIIEFDGLDFIFHNSQNSAIPEDFIYSIAADSKDNIWFTSCRFRQGGIVK